MRASGAYPVCGVSECFQNGGMPALAAPTEADLRALPIGRRFSMDAAHALKGIHSACSTAPFPLFIGIPMVWYLQTEAMERLGCMGGLRRNWLLLHIMQLSHNSANLSSILLVCFTKACHLFSSDEIETERFNFGERKGGASRQRPSQRHTAHSNSCSRCNLDAI